METNHRSLWRPIIGGYGSSREPSGVNGAPMRPAKGPCHGIHPGGSGLVETNPGSLWRPKGGYAYGRLCELMESSYPFPIVYMFMNKTINNAYQYILMYCIWYYEKLARA